jgi:ribonuclease G
MQQDILINWSPQETRVALSRMAPCRSCTSSAAGAGLVGNIYLGKVSRVLPGMQSAFIDIGLERAAFCTWPMSGSQESGEAPMFARKDQPLTPIEKQVFEGQSMMVQVIKDP